MTENATLETNKQVTIYELLPSSAIYVTEGKVNFIGPGTLTGGSCVLIPSANAFQCREGNSLDYRPSIIVLEIMPAQLGVL